MADEANHRDVNHTFADMKEDDPNPFVEQHKANALIAWRLNQSGEPAWQKSASNTGKPTVVAVPINCVKDSTAASQKKLIP